MIDKTKILILARKLNELALKGEGGEKINASKKLDELMKKHSITLEMINGEDVEMEIFKYKPIHKNLLIACMGYVIGKSLCIYGSRNKRNAIATKCTKAQYLEILSVFDFFKRKFDYQLDVFESAFIQKNRILPQDADTMDLSEMSEDEIERLRDIIKMRDSISKSDYLKQLGA